MIRDSTIHDLSYYTVNLQGNVGLNNSIFHGKQ